MPISLCFMPSSPLRFLLPLWRWVGSLVHCAREGSSRFAVIRGLVSFSTLSSFLRPTCRPSSSFPRAGPRSFALPPTTKRAVRVRSKFPSCPSLIIVSIPLQILSPVRQPPDRESPTFQLAGSGLYHLDRQTPRNEPTIHYHRHQTQVVAHYQPRNSVESIDTFAPSKESRKRKQRRSGRERGSIEVARCCDRSASIQDGQQDPRGICRR